MKLLLRVIPLLFLIACVREIDPWAIDPKQIDRVKQNLGKIKPGMNKEQVKQLLGNPRKAKGGLGPLDPLKCIECELWIYPADEETIDWPQIAFEETTNKVTKVFCEEPDEYFLF
jgi:hypothetical protein